MKITSKAFFNFNFIFYNNINYTYLMGHELTVNNCCFLLNNINVKLNVKLNVKTLQ